MTDRIRQSLGGLCLAAVVLGLGAVVRANSGPATVSEVLLFGGGLIAVVCLLNIALDLMSAGRDG